MFQPPKIPIILVRHRNTRLLSTQPQSAHNDYATPTWRKSFQENLKQYLLSTTLHGLKYVGDNTITLFER